MNEAPAYAGFWVRTVAMLIDTLLLMLLIGPVMLTVYSPEQLAALQHAGFGGGLVGVLFNYLVPGIVFVVFWVYKSATPGKILLKLEIVDAGTGGKPSNGQFIGRYLAYYVSAIPLMLGFAWIALDRRKQGFHDKLAGTLVVRRSGDREASFGVER